MTRKTIYHRAEKNYSLEIAAEDFTAYRSVSCQITTCEATFTYSMGIAHKDCQTYSARDYLKHLSDLDDQLPSLSSYLSQTSDLGDETPPSLAYLRQVLAELQGQAGQGLAGRADAASRPSDG